MLERILKDLLATEKSTAANDVAAEKASVAAFIAMKSKL